MLQDDLLANRDDLVTLSYRLAEMVGDEETEKNNSDFIRVINIAKHQDGLIEKDIPYNKSEVSALLKNESYYKDAVQKKSIAFKSDTLLKQVNTVLWAMNQRIGYAIKEKNNSAYSHNAITRK